MAKWMETGEGKSAAAFGNAVAIVVTVIMLWAAHNVIYWDQPLFDFVKKMYFPSVFWIIDLTLGIAIITRLFRILIPTNAVKSLMQIIDNFFNLIMIIVLISIFPYDFTKLIGISWINTAVKILMLLGLSGVIVSTVVEVHKLVAGKTAGK